MQDSEYKKLRAIIDSCKNNPNPEKLAEAVERLSIDHYFTDRQYIPEALDDYLLLIEQCQKPEEDDARLVTAVLYLYRATQLYQEKQPELAGQTNNRGIEIAEAYFEEKLDKGDIKSFEDVKRILHEYDVIYNGYGTLVTKSVIGKLYGDSFVVPEMRANLGVEDTT